MFEPDFTNPNMASSLTPLVPWIKQENVFLPNRSSGHEQSLLSASASAQQIKQEVFPEDPPIRQPCIEWPPGARYNRPKSYPKSNPRRRSKIPELAALWPVYVNNFRCPLVEDRDQAIRKFFSKKALRVHWWFSRMDEYYFDFQQTAGLYDMLVYFGSEAEAQLAIKKCHLERCLDFRMNVLPGREPVFFPQGRSVYVRHMEDGRDTSEEFFECALKKFGQVRCVVKFDMYSGAAEMATAQDAKRVQHRAASGSLPWPLEPVGAKIRKQRYLECDVLDIIEPYLSTNLHELKPPRTTLKPQKKPRPSFGQLQPTEVEKSLQKRVNKMRRKIERALDQGEQPHCPLNSTGGKKMFKQLLQEALDKRGGQA